MSQSPPPPSLNRSGQIVQLKSRSVSSSTSDLPRLGATSRPSISGRQSLDGGRPRQSYESDRSGPSTSPRIRPAGPRPGSSPRLNGGRRSISGSLHSGSFGDGYASGSSAGSGGGQRRASETGTGSRRSSDTKTIRQPRPSLPGQSGIPILASRIPRSTMSPPRADTLNNRPTGSIDEGFSPRTPAEGPVSISVVNPTPERSTPPTRFRRKSVDRDKNGGKASSVSSGSAKRSNGSVRQSDGSDQAKHGSSGSRRTSYHLNDTYSQSSTSIGSQPETQSGPSRLRKEDDSSLPDQSDILTSSTMYRKASSVPSEPGGIPTPTQRRRSDSIHVEDNMGNYDPNLPLRDFPTARKKPSLSILPKIEIPQRTSSSATESVLHISPRTSSMEFAPAPRRASLADIFASIPRPHRTTNDQASSPPSSSEKREQTIKPGPSEAAPPVLDRKHPGLVVALPPPPTHIRSASASTVPSPPIPTKSPLRGLHRNTSSFSDLHTREQATTPNAGTNHARQVSEDIPNMPTPTTSEIRFTMMASSEYPQRPEQNTAGDWPPSTRSSGVLTSEELPPRSTILSMYSQASADEDTRQVSTYSQISETSSSRPSTSMESITSDETRDDTVTHGMDDQLIVPENEVSVSRKSTLGSIDWGRKKSDFSVIGADKDLPEIPSTTSSAMTPSGPSASGPRPITPSHVASRSPSMPNMSPSGKAARLLGIADPIPDTRRKIPAPLLPSALTRSPTAPDFNKTASALTTSMSKRSYLIREIATTERAYANDLGLVRDAYLAKLARPGSQASLGESSRDTPSFVSPGLSESSRRSSVYTYQTAETKRSSGADWPLPPNIPLTPGKSSPGDSGYFTPSVPGSTSTPNTLASPPPRISAVRARGKALSPADIKAVFLNLAELAGIADELASGFEGAIGEDGSGREGESGTDRLGEVFSNLLPRLRPLYTFYCARQSTASTRLMELQADPGHALNLSDCWAVIKPHTHAWNLDSMLIKPVQRITKYPLLFDDLLASTTPVHPDYFSIRSAAEKSREVAMEIDEVKRRKDVVAGVINRRPPVLASAVPVKNKGLRMFKKDKPTGAPLSLTMSASSSDLGTPLEITSASHVYLKDLTLRVEEGEQVVRRVGKEIVLWVAAAKDLLAVEDLMMKSWMRVVQLEGNDPADQRLGAFRRTLGEIVAEAWGVLNDDVRDHILPIFAKLLESSTNPKKVIARRDAKSADYARFSTLRDTKRPIDRNLLASAGDFAALHTQLLDELPAFLEGYMRILDIAVCAFSRAQGRYHQAVWNKMGNFSKRWIALPRRGSAMGPGTEELDINTGRGIVKAWHDSWSPFAEAMEHFQITRPARHAATRLASFNNRPGSRPSSPGPTLRHSPSVASNHSSRPSSPAPARPSHVRQRSSSLLGPNAGALAVSPMKESRFGLFRSNSKTSIKEKDRPINGNGLPSPSPAARLRPSVTSENRYSFGLPRISAAEPIFEAIGLSPTKSIRITSDPQGYTTTPPSSGPKHPFSNVNPSESSLLDVNAGLGFGQVVPPPHRISLSDDGPVDSRRMPLSDDEPVQPQLVSLGGDPAQQSRRTSLQSEGPVEPRRISLNKEIPVDPRRISLSDDGPVPSRRTSIHEDRAIQPPRRPSRTENPRTRPKADLDAAEGWRNETVLYQCGCVADFDPRGLGNKRYRGLKFLTMGSGDLIDVFHEVGRIDELPSFPYPEVGVDNDGVLVGRAESGAIGLVICSFLEPLRD